MVEPLGDGSTSRSMPSTSDRLAGESETCRASPRDIASKRPTASVAPWRTACSAARASRQRNGKTSIPRSIATLSVVVKESTSTTTA